VIQLNRKTVKETQCRKREEKNIKENKESHLLADLLELLTRRPLAGFDLDLLLHILQLTNNQEKEGELSSVIARQRNLLTALSHLNGSKYLPIPFSKTQKEQTLSHTQSQQNVYLRGEHEASTAHGLNGAHNVQRKLLRIHTSHDQVGTCLDVI